MRRTILYSAFFLSGAAGLIYEVVWSRYLALFVGHSAEAQVLVIAMFLGGLALGSVLVGRVSARIRAPLRGYALVELAVAVVGVTFHLIFVWITEAAYGVWFPALDPLMVGALKWLIAAALVFIPATLLGTTFPLMAAGLTRRDGSAAGRIVSVLYFVNSFGGALFVLVAGFGLIPAFGLPGTLWAAAALNVVAALLTFASRSAEARDRSESTTDPVRATIELSPAARRLLLVTAGLTAVASFAYQIGWIRMLSLVMGSATHAFEIMLSAFILGLALGAWLIRRVAANSPRPLRALGRVQWAMGLCALATLPLFTASFGWVGDLVARLPAHENGYLLFNIGRYGIALVVMLPATLLAGMTLPLITATLLRAGTGEKAIGFVYGVNTTGAIIGVSAAGLLALPVLGLKGMLLAGAVLDMALGVVILARDEDEQEVLREQPPAEIAGPWRRGPVPAACVGMVAAGIVWIGLSLDAALLTSGTFRYGRVDPESLDVLYYADGRTASIGVHRTGSDGLVVLTSNGKPDASLTGRWLSDAGQTVEPWSIRQQDEATQMLSALVSLAHVPEARRAAVIGHGSGISGHFLLTAPDLESLVSVEIEPRVIDASALYYPANRLVFDDPRSRLAIADAKSFFAQASEPFDLILSEPSNPWVSGTASLFSVEFYRQVRDYLSEDGVFAQWFHVYEIDDALIGSVLAAIHEAFPSYVAYLIGDTDVMVVASPSGSTPEPDWGLLSGAALRAELNHLRLLSPDHLEGLKLFERGDLEPLFPGWSSPNSDFAPILDTRAEKTRFMNAFGHGFYGLAVDRFQLAAALGGWRRAPGKSVESPLPGLLPVLHRTNALAARSWLADPGIRLPAESAEAARRARDAFATLLAADEEWEDRRWADWVGAFVTVEHTLHAGTAGFSDAAFFARIAQILDRSDAPSLVRSVVDFYRGLAGWDFDAVAHASGAVATAAIEGHPLVESIDRGLLLDATVVSLIKTGESARARAALVLLAPESGRAADDFRVALLRAHVEAGQSARPLATR